MPRELLIAWLNDAYAIERAHITALRQYIKDFDEYIDIRSELRQHLTDTEEMISSLEETIIALGGKILKVHSGNGFATPTSTSPYHDELVKDLLLIYGAEQFGYINYLAIADAANHIDEDEVADMCERAAEEKRIMAEWAEEQLSTVISSCIKATAEE